MLTSKREGIIDMKKDDAIPLTLRNLSTVPFQQGWIILNKEKFLKVYFSPKRYFEFSTEYIEEAECFEETISFEDIEY